MLEKEENNNEKNYDIEIIKIRKDIAETVLDLQKEIEELKEIINSLKEDSINIDNINNVNKFKSEKINLKEDIISEVDFSNRIDTSKEELVSEKYIKVKKLIDKGLSEDEICKELSMGKGEILLIKSLLKK